MKCAYIGTAVIGLVSTTILFIFAGQVASLFCGQEDLKLLLESTRAIRLFCFAYLFRWFVVTTQGLLSAIEKPVLATIMSVSVAFVFPLAMLAVMWSMGIDGIWLNFVGVNLLAAVLGIFLLLRVVREIRKKTVREQK